MAAVRFQKIPKFVIWSGAIVGAAGGLTWLMLFLAGAFQPKVSTERISTTSPGDVKPRLVEVQSQRQVRSETAVGTVRAIHEASVASKLLARVVEVRVTAGQAVQQGEVLIRLDDADLQARLKQMEAAHVAAEAVLERATSEHDRASKLVAKKVISRAEHEQAVAALKTAQAEVQRTRQAADEAQILLEFATLRSPLTGIIIDKRVEVGDTASPGQILVNLYEPNRMQMVVTVRESLAQRLKVGDQVPARLDALEHECLATVSEIVPQAESASRSFTVKVTGPCPPGAYSGMFGRITIPLDEEEIVVVPASAIIRVGQLELVEVPGEGGTRRRAVQLGRRIDRGFEVLSGLKVGEQVVIQTPGEDQR